MGGEAGYNGVREEGVSLARPRGRGGEEYGEETRRVERGAYLSSLTQREEEDEKKGVRGRAGGGEG